MKIRFPWIFAPIFFFAVLASINQWAMTPPPVEQETIPVRPETSSIFLSPVPTDTSHPSLRPLADEKGIYFGTSVQSKYLDSDNHYNRIVQRDFNIITPEDEMKMCETWPARHQYNFHKADRIVDFAKKHNLSVRGHTLIWHECIPDWVLKNNLSRQEARELLKTYILTIVGRYKNQVAIWDVLNETASWKPLWADLIGEEYAEHALQWAHQADPQALLFYNDYDIEGVNKKSDEAYQYLKGLKEKGVPIHGIGFQMHLWMAGRPRPNPESVARNIKRFNELGLEVQITEMDVLTNTLLGKMEEEQAKVYYDMLRVCLEAKKCTAFTMWGFSDRHTWYRYYLKQAWANPLIYDDRYRPKTAYYGLVRAFQDTKSHAHFGNNRLYPK